MMNQEKKLVIGINHKTCQSLTRFKLKEKLWEREKMIIEVKQKYEVVIQIETLNRFEIPISNGIVQIYVLEQEIDIQNVTYPNDFKTHYHCEFNTRNKFTTCILKKEHQPYQIYDLNLNVKVVIEKDYYDVETSHRSISDVHSMIEITDLGNEIELTGYDLQKIGNELKNKLYLIFNPK